MTWEDSEYIIDQGKEFLRGMGEISESDFIRLVRSLDLTSAQLWVLRRECKLPVSQEPPSGLRHNKPDVARAHEHVAKSQAYMAILAAANRLPSAAAKWAGGVPLRSTVSA